MLTRMFVKVPRRWALPFKKDHPLLEPVTTR
ncbi:hypothetical protein PanWU01x14_162460 [Parasponia andersonii]|uniref:Uncharacterized protein n=1 Tax=Parasponia andersonii TaxID=3476 RepID=A0A2P5CDP7_PARAD|nr:hypothetical protein PanWU01x14_162460 [Parasponia andersonii]